ncbi:trypsin-like peptidase domain-containing protein [Candidatus Uhrbacteria bacterium]|nr:trypsin-like peptidase domain-containing protein [Candidatus Uhrbacteria bacterium]
MVSKDLSKIYGRTGVNIFPFDSFFDLDFPFQFRTTPQGNGEGQKQQIGGGSGFIISSDGMILTNKHVVGDADADYSVITNDGKEYAAKVIAKDPVNDLAIVKIDAKNVPALELGDSNSIQIGQTVIAIGNSLGEYSNTVTRGVISGINRVVTAADGSGAIETLQEAIQTDAAINPGNSGGPLLNLTGQVIAINTAINRSGQSIGFALPINVAKRSVESVKKFGKIIRPWLGVRYVLIDDELARKNNLSVTYGALIVGNPQKKELSVIPNSPADKAGLQDGDIILELQGLRISREHALANAITQHSPGDEVKLKILSKGKEKTVKVKLEEFKSNE